MSKKRVKVSNQLSLPIETSPIQDNCTGMIADQNNTVRILNFSLKQTQGFRKRVLSDLIDNRVIVSHN